MEPGYNLARHSNNRYAHKNGVAIVHDMLKELPEVYTFTRSSAPINLKKYNKVPSLDELRKVATLKARIAKYKSRQPAKYGLWLP